MKAGPVLLEPVMELEIRSRRDARRHDLHATSPATAAGTCIDQGNEADGTVTVIKAHVPLATVQTYHRDLKSQTAGEGTFAMRFVALRARAGAASSRILAQVGKKHDRRVRPPARAAGRGRPRRRAEALGVPSFGVQSRAARCRFPGTSVTATRAPPIEAGRARRPRRPTRPPSDSP